MVTAALPQDSALPLVEALMPCVSRLLEKGRFPGRWLPACAVLRAPLLLLLLLLAEPAAPLAHQPALPGVCQPASSQQPANKARNTSTTSVTASICITISKNHHQR